MLAASIHALGSPVAVRAPALQRLSATLFAAFDSWFETYGNVGTSRFSTNEIPANNPTYRNLNFHTGRLPPNVPVCVAIGSDYVLRGVRQLASWEVNDWQSGPTNRSRRVKHAELWQRLANVLSRRECSVKWTKGATHGRLAACCVSRAGQQDQDAMVAGSMRTA
jgi:hypothetical protein